MGPLKNGFGVKQGRFDPWANRPHRNTHTTETSFWIHWAKIHASWGKVWTRWKNQKIKQAQLMLTNPRDALKCQSRSPNIVPFHMLCIFPLVQLSYSTSKKCRDLEIWVTGHSRSLKMTPFYRLVRFPISVI